MFTDINRLRKGILAARNNLPPDLVLRGGKVVNVFSGKIQKRDVAVSQGIIVGMDVGYSSDQEHDVTGKWIVPGLIDAHMHIESTMLAPSGLYRSLLIHGTTAVVADPHEIGNVMGLHGIRFMLQDSRDLPLDIFFMAPSCVPASHLETAGAQLEASELDTLKHEPRILGLGELMNVPGVLAGADPILEKILRFQDRVMDGHCPGLRGKDLQAYVTAGIGSDHETTGPSEGLEKLESGMMIMIREGTSAKNMEPLLPLVTPATSRRFCLVTDDLHAEDIQERGHLDFVVSKATGLGLDPVTAIQMVTLNPAEFFGLTDRGAIGPGFRADLVVLDDLEDMRVSAVYKDGCRVVDQGEMVGNHGTRKGPSMAFTQTVHIPVLDPAHLRIPHAQGRARVIEVIPGQIITRAVEFEPPQSEGVVVPDLEADVLKLTVVERHTGGGNVGLGLVKGFGLTQGALASSVAHDSHNVIAVGVTDGEMLRAIEEIRRMGGGLVAVRGEAILARVKLEIAGLMSRQPLEEVVRELKALKEGAAALGCRLEEPFMALSFLALPVIPELKLTDMGLVDVAAFRIVPLFLEHQEVT